MNPILTALLSAGLALNTALYAYMLSLFHRRQKQAGEKLAGWSRVSELSFMENRLLLALFLFFAGWCGWQILHSPGSPGGYRSSLILLFALANAPRWNVVVGQAGIVYRLKFIPWQIVKARTILYRNSRTLLVLHLGGGSMTDLPKTLTIPIPKRVDLHLP